MSWGIVLSETMSGWISFNDENQRRPFAFSIKAFTPKLFSLTTPRRFKGVASFPGYHDDVVITGTLIIRPTGPLYDLELELEGHGTLRIAGHKTYDIRDLRKSLTTCPLLVYKNGSVIGQAEVAYRDSMLAFPFQSLRIAASPF